MAGSEAGAGGTENMHQGMLFSKSWRRQHEMGNEGCGLILILILILIQRHRGSGGNTGSSLSP